MAGLIRFLLQNFTPGNAGVIFYTDILLPLLGGVLVWLEYRATRADAHANGTRHSSSGA
jgi:hypothetical protein